MLKSKLYQADFALFYSYPYEKDASTIMEHVESFKLYSNRNVTLINTAFGFPKNLKNISFKSMIFHYSLFGAYPFSLKGKFLDYAKKSTDSFKIALFQDEHQNCLERFAIINSLGIDRIYSLLDEKYYDEVYRKNTSVTEIFHTLTGYVSDRLLDKAKFFCLPMNRRKIDVGYRARNLPYYCGRGGREKAEIAERFIATVQCQSIMLDISTREEDRIYGDEWYSFIGNCKFMLGVEAGTSIVDLTGEVKALVKKFLENNPSASFEEVHRHVLYPYEEKIHYRTISPRIFECAALKTCMILFRGDYQGILLPGIHYICLEKDFSNIMEVLDMMSNESAIKKIVDRAYNDLIVSKKFSYQNFVESFFSSIPIISDRAQSDVLSSDQVMMLLSQDLQLRSFIKKAKTTNFPGRPAIKWVGKKLRLL